MSIIIDDQNTSHSGHLPLWYTLATIFDGIHSRESSLVLFPPKCKSAKAGVAAVNNSNLKTLTLTNFSMVMQTMRRMQSTAGRTFDSSETPGLRCKRITPFLCFESKLRTCLHQTMHILPGAPKPASEG
jgi:hypothetical protein